MRSLVVVLTGIGTMAGIVMGVLAHHGASQARGWTFYVPLDRYSDYLPTRHPSWFPGILEYAAVGLVAGLLVAGVLIAGGFRLVRAAPGK